MVYTILSLVLLLLFSYLMGSIPFSLVVGKLFFKKDIRNYGSLYAACECVLSYIKYTQI